MRQRGGTARFPPRRPPPRMRRARRDAAAGRSGADRRGPTRPGPAQPPGCAALRRVRSPPTPARAPGPRRTHPPPPPRPRAPAAHVPRANGSPRSARHVGAGPGLARGLTGGGDVTAGLWARLRGRGRGPLGEGERRSGPARPGPARRSHGGPALPGAAALRTERACRPPGPCPPARSVSSRCSGPEARPGPPPVLPSPPRPGSPSPPFALTLRGAFPLGLGASWPRWRAPSLWPRCRTGTCSTSC